MTRTYNNLTDILANGKINTAVIRRDWFKDTPLYKQIISYKIDFIPINLSEHIYCFSKGITSRPKCVCGKDLKFITFTIGYRKSCSNICSRKIKGDDWKSPSSSIIINTTKEKADLYQYITSNDSIPPDIREFLNEKMKKRDNDTFNHYFDRTDYRNNKSYICGLINLTKHLIPFNNLKDLKLCERMYLYLNNITELPKCKVTNKPLKFIDTKVGYSKYPSRRDIKHVTINRIQPILKSQGFDWININDFMSNNLTYTTATLKCNKCNNIDDYDLWNGRWHKVYCSICNPFIHDSSQELEVYEYVKTIYSGNILRNYKYDNGNRKEIDIYLPDIKLGIEFNGELFHSFGTTYPNNASYENKNKHLNKLNDLNNLGITVMQINSSEWEDDIKREIWKSIINVKINKVIAYHARALTVISLDNDTKDNFLIHNHLQGTDKSSVRLGLKDSNNELLAVMTFSKARFTDQFEYEMLRYSCKRNIRVNGGAGKLLKYFISKYSPNSIITYADKRYSNGNLYKKLNFTLKGSSAPKYTYIKNGIHYHRLLMQKHKLKDRADIKYDESKSETELLFEAKYRRYWDCGNYVFFMYPTT